MPPVQTFTAYIDPSALQGKAPAVAGPLGVQGFQPSAPHSGSFELGEGIPIDPGPPPIVGAGHYTNLLDEIWPQFDTPEKRTAKKLAAVLEAVADEANKVNLLAMGLFDKAPAYKITDADRKRWQKEFLAYAKRLNAYRVALGQLPPDSIHTDSVYVGLIRRRDGAGPVPDVIMHMYFADQLRILDEHYDEMGRDFTGRVLDTLVGIGQSIEGASEQIGDELVEQQERRQRRWWIIGGLVGGGGLLSLMAVLLARRSDP